MLLAAGRGERMRPLTDHTPKPLLMAGGKPLIVWHIERLVRAGITDLIINHAHLGDRIEAALGNGSQLGTRIRYSNEGTALETAGGIAFALPLLGDAPFAVINGDIWCDYDFSRLPQRAAALAASGDMAHLVLVNNPEHHPQGDFCLEQQRITPTPSVLSSQSSILTFSGIGIYRPSLFAAIRRGSRAPLAPLLREQIALGKVGGEHHRGLWMDIGTPERLAELDKQLRTTQNTAHD
jgi:MurNAc alpha-1-phosphate uridylyltransferase